MGTYNHFAGKMSPLFAVLVVVVILVATPRLAEADVAGPQDDQFDEIDRMGAGQLSEKADSFVSEMRQVLNHVLGMLEDARTEKDVVKLNCVNEKLTHVRGLVRVSEEGQVSMQEAIARQDMDEARHEFTKIVVARDRVSQLRAEAEECVGQLAFVVDEELEVEVEVPPDLPDVVTDLLPVPPVVIRPPMASPFR